MKMIYKNRINKLKKKDFEIYIDKYKDFRGIGIGYQPIIILFLVNIIFMLTMYMSIVVYQEVVLPSVLLEILSIYGSLMKAQIILISIDIVLRTYFMIKHFFDLNTFLRRCKV